MKKILFVLLAFLFSLGANAQSYSYSEDLPVKGDKIVFEKIVDGISLDKPVLFATSKKWMIDKLKNIGPVIQSEDIATGQIIGKGYIDNSEDAPLLKAVYASRTYKFSIQVDVKDGKYRARIYDLILNVKVGAVEETNLDLNKAMAQSPPIIGKNKIERARTTAKEINTIFTRLLNSLHESIKETKKDEF